MSAASHVPESRGVTNEVLSVQLSHLQQSFDEERARAREEQTEIRALLAEHTTRIRSVEDDRLRAWTVIGVVAMFGMTGIAAFVKLLLAN